MRALLVLLPALLASFAYAGQSEQLCPKVYDGLGGFDAEYSAKADFVGVSWVFPKASMLARVEVAVYSDKLLRGDALKSCQRALPFTGLPDVAQWTAVANPNQSWTMLSGLHLQENTRYFSVLRLIYQDGNVLYAMSNGFRLMPAAEREKRSVEDGLLPGMEAISVHGSKKRNIPPPFGSQGAAVASCLIDEENRCRAAQETVGDKLNTLYGKPEFRNMIYPERDAVLEYLALTGVSGYLDPSIDTPTPRPRTIEELRQYVADRELVPFVFNRSDDDDSSPLSSGALAGALIAVILGVLLLALLLLAAIIAFFALMKGEEKPFSERVVSREVEDVDASLGQREEHSLGTDPTRVEFPDIDPSARLSVAPE